MHTASSFSTQQPLAYGMTDSNWATDALTRRSQSGTAIFLGNNLIRWSSRKQTMVTLSSTEAEYIALCSTNRSTVALRQLLIDLDIVKPDFTIPVYIDNTTALSIANHGQVTERSKHFDIRSHYNHQLVENKIRKNYKVHTLDNLADFFTKPLERNKFQELRSKLGLEQLRQRGVLDEM